MSLTFNGITKHFVHATVETQRPIWAPVERELIEIPGRSGAFFRNTKVKPRVIPVGIIIKGVADLQKAKEEVAEWLITDKPAPLILPDEPDRTYYAMIDGEGQLSEVFKFGKGTVNFVCPAPYKYGAEQSFDISSRADGVNLVRNGDFSDGLTNWRTWQTGSAGNTRGLTDITDFDGDDHKFTKGFYYSAVASEQYGYAQDTVSLKAGETYTLTAWFKVTSGAGQVRLQTGNAVDGWTYTNYDVAPILGKWTKLSHTFTAKSDSTSIYLGQTADGNGNYNSAEVTGVQVARGSSASYKWNPYLTQTVTSAGTASTYPIIECTFTQAADKYEVQLLNDDLSVNAFVLLNFDFIAGDKLVLDFANRAATLNGEDKKTAYHITSDFFKIPPKKDTPISATQPSTLKFTDKYL
ncbi:distal tail protein Dit [Bacillus licheniformis]|uniref:distal tail protein Dit n=1 Tax=Bacillus licheniformis TaxID=1402 RepID=UPI002E1C00DC|nr:distal tail protein Dit [Bacillus licheniformis]MED4411010.1 phage tail family protein [Bacillus licheniformis]